jgi:hypothetical protein
MNFLISISWPAPDSSFFSSSLVKTPMRFAGLTQSIAARKRQSEHRNSSLRSA